MKAGEKAAAEKLPNTLMAGDPMAVAKQQINNERINNEMKHLVKNRTSDFVQNPMTRKFQSFTVLNFPITDRLLPSSRVHLSKAEPHDSKQPDPDQVLQASPDLH